MFLLRDRPADAVTDDVNLVPVTSANWREVAKVRPTVDQRAWVADVLYYLCLSAYDGLWRSYAVVTRETIVGHVMWAVDPDDASHWIGGLVIDQVQQGKGYGRAAVTALLAMWERDEPSLSGTPFREAALSVSPDNAAALQLYRSMGFAETGEIEDDEVVLRRVRED
jgi:diamine N-acetyltransferase